MTVTTQNPGEVWTIDAVRKLPATVDIETAGAVLGIGRSKSYELAKAGEFPVRVLRIGRDRQQVERGQRALLGDGIVDLHAGIGFLG